MPANIREPLVIHIAVDIIVVRYNHFRPPGFGFIVTTLYLVSLTCSTSLNRLQDHVVIADGRWMIDVATVVER